MTRRTTEAQNIIAQQERMLRLAERDYGLSIKVLHAETNIPKETLATWKADTAMPAWALVVLSRVIPDELTSLLFEAAGKFVGTDHSDDGDLDALAREAAGYNVEYLEARDPKSDGGAAITPRERERLKDRSRRMSSIARRAAA